MGRTHATSGAVLALASVPLLQRYGLDTSPLSVVWMAIGGAGAAMLPDFDHRHATVAHSLGPISKGMAIGIEKVSGGHRNGTHSILGILVFTGFALAVNQAKPVLVHFGVHDSALWSRVAMGAWIAFLLSVTSAAFHLKASNIKWVHTLVCILGGVAIIGLSAWFPFPFDTLPYAVLAGTTAHILGDMLTKEGCPLLWPFVKFRFHVANFTTDHFFEHYIFSPLLAVVLLVQVGFLVGAGPALTWLGQQVWTFLVSLAR